MRAAGRAEKREHRSWGALGVGLGVVAGEDGQKRGFSRTWIGACLYLSGFPGNGGRLRTVRALEVPTIPGTD